MIQKLKNLQKSESGIVHLALLLVVVGALSAVGFVGYNVWQKNTSFADSVGNVVGSCTSKGFSSSSQTTLRLNNATDKGYVRVYYKESNAKTDWCAVTVKQGSTRGTKSPTYVSIKAQDGTEYSKDSGNYTQNTSGVIVNNDKCVKVYGHVEYKGKRYKTSGSSVTICHTTGSSLSYQ